MSKHAKGLQYPVTGTQADRIRLEMGGETLTLVEGDLQRVDLWDFEDPAIPIGPCCGIKLEPDE